MTGVSIGGNRNCRIAKHRKTTVLEYEEPEVVYSIEYIVKCTWCHLDSTGGLQASF